MRGIKIPQYEFALKNAGGGLCARGGIFAGHYGIYYQVLLFVVIKYPWLFSRCIQNVDVGGVQKGYVSWWLSINHSLVVEHWRFKPGALVSILSYWWLFTFLYFYPVRACVKGLDNWFCLFVSFSVPVKNF